MLYHMLSSSQNKEVKYNQAEELARLILGLGHQTDTINGTNDDGVGLCLQTHICRRKAQSKKTKKPNLHAPLSQNQAQVTTASCSTYHSQNIEFVHFIPFTENVGCPLYVDMMSYASSPHRYRWHRQASLSCLSEGTDSTSWACKFVLNWIPGRRHDRGVGYMLEAHVATAALAHLA